MPSNTELRLAAIKDVLADNPHYEFQTDTVVWLVERVEGWRAMYQERFNEGLTQAEWHTKHCAAMQQIQAVLALHHETEESAPHRVNRVCAEDGKAWPCPTAREMGVRPVPPMVPPSNPQGAL